MIGGYGFKIVLIDVGFLIKNDEYVDYVVIGLDEKVIYEKLLIVILVVCNGVKFIFINLDVFIFKERGFLFGNGVIMSVVSVFIGI